MQNVARLSDLSEHHPTAIEIGDDSLILVRDGDAVHAFEGKCPHAGAPLAKGAVCGGKIICPWHKAEFAVADGALLEPPALNGLVRYRVEVRGGDVLVDPVKQKPVAATPSPVRDERRVVLLGAGAAATACASALREFGFGGAITMISKEPDPPYDRTALSKFVLEGGKAPDEISPLRPADFYRDHDIDRIHAEISSLDVPGRKVVLADGRALDYTHALLATGGVPNRLEIDGAGLDGVFTLRSKADSAQIVERAKAGGKAVILGSSFIGLEAASALRKRGLDVAVVTPEAIPFTKQFGERLGTMFRDLHEKNGVVFHSETQASRLTGTNAVDGVELKDGSRLPADLVLVGIGVHPATDFVDGIERAKDGGIDVNGQMMAAPGLWAAGDVARFPLHDDSTRIEHWRVAQQHGRIVARNINGEPARYDGVPFFWTYHYGKRYEYLGHATKWDEVVVEGTLEEADFVALLVSSGQVAGALACNRERATAELIVRMRDGVGVDDALSLIRAA